jgi:hypothetical protein
VSIDAGDASAASVQGHVITIGPDGQFFQPLTRSAPPGARHHLAGVEIRPLPAVQGAAVASREAASAAKKNGWLLDGFIPASLWRNGLNRESGRIPRCFRLGRWPGPVKTALPTSCGKTSIGPSAKARGDLGSAAYSVICAHFQEPRNAGSRPEAPFIHSLLGRGRLLLDGTVFFLTWAPFYTKFYVGRQFPERRRPRR